MASHTIQHASTSEIGRRAFDQACELAREIGSSNKPFTLAHAQEWHRTAMLPLLVDPEVLVGNFRTNEQPDLQLSSRVVDGFDQTQWVTVDPGLVQEQLDRFIVSTNELVLGALPGSAPTTALDTEAQLQVLAVTYSEWLRIHPFFDGNGRTAIAWSHAISARFGHDAFPYSLGSAHWTSVEAREAHRSACRAGSNADRGGIIELFRAELDASTKTHGTTTT